LLKIRLKSQTDTEYGIAVTKYLICTKNISY